MGPNVAGSSIIVLLTICGLKIIETSKKSALETFENFLGFRVFYAKRSYTDMFRDDQVPIFAKDLEKNAP